MELLLKAITEFGSSLWDLSVALLAVLVPWTPLAAWIVFWLFAVNWLKLRETLAKGGWVGLVLIAAIMVLVWGNIAPGSGSFNFFGRQLNVGNFVEKTVYVSGLFVMMLLAGALQLSGFCAGSCQFDEPVKIAETHGHDAGHDAGHGDSHGHGTHH